MRRIRNERGMVLLVVVILVALLSAILVDQTYRQLIDLRLVETFRDRTKAYYLARGGLKAGQAVLNEDKNSYDALPENWAQPLEGVQVGQGTISLRMEALDGRYALNRLVTVQGNVDVIERDRLLRLLTELEIEAPDERVATILDWLDPDSDTRIGGAESDYYQSPPLAYPARNGPMDSLEELQRLRGFDKELIAKIRPHVSIHGSYAINLNLASREVVLSLHESVTEAEWEALKEKRQEAPLEELSDVRELLGWEPIYLSIKPQLSVSSNIYRILAEGRVGRGIRRMEAVYVKNNGTVLTQKAF